MDESNWQTQRFFLLENPVNEIAEIYWYGKSQCDVHINPKAETQQKKKKKKKLQFIERIFLTHIVRSLNGPWRANLVDM